MKSPNEIGIATGNSFVSTNTEKTGDQPKLIISQRFISNILQNHSISYKKVNSVYF